ncbi:putative bifunctional diguanylate cyclase/phosphodiesterase [Azonexus sp. IMCC34842]|uniref:putative bifunctional diguanylate cyclase/phosphodiesterase n=1 Tax=Azonexus sp. IMCC34842 TaxID=3420950 RepID=UPI003D111DDE
MPKKNIIRHNGATSSSPAGLDSEQLPPSAARHMLSAREATLIAGERSADQREEKADRRQATADQRQENADQRQENADLRQEAADLRQKAADLSEAAARAKSELGVITEAHLREANERLVVATVHAQTMTEAAEKATAQMAYMAQHDFLTGLPNRALLNDRLTQSIALAQRHGKRVALMYLDLDHFKHINDSLGHAIGDQLLQSAAARLQACLPRHSDTVSRQGGDEFVVLLAEIEAAQDAVVAAEKLIKAMREPHLIAGHRLHVTLSIGISLYPDDGKDAETVVKNADTAMYHAKTTGRNNYQMFTPDMNVNAVARRSVEEALHQALEEDGFVLHYQPKMNLETGAIAGAEALVRMRPAGQALVSPTEFINVAENCGLILPLGRWVLGEACRQTVEWLAAGLDIGHIAVNVSAVEFHSEGFLAGVRAILDESGLDPSRLELEMTESGLMQDTTPTAEILRALKALGVQIAIDDFGTGYSSLSYLRRFPIDTLKIDQSFVQDIDGDTDGEEVSLIGAIIAMGKSLKLRVIAEGIETSQQLAFLQSHHCAEGQGYYFNRPLPAAEFAALLKPDSLS